MIILKYGSDGRVSGAHAVLAFGADEDDGQLFIYDPNHPGENRQIVFDTEGKSFEQYEGYSKFFLGGTGTYSLDESFENIFDDAEHNFTTDNQPNINITSHENGATVTERNIVLTGAVESSEVLITKLEVYVGNDKFSTNVNIDGSFSVPVSLETGDNELRFVTLGEHGTNNLLKPVTPNNLDSAPFSINVDSSLSVMLVTLTWDKSDTDLDLYVIDPTGDYSAYFNEITADGGELDYDVTRGFGPEHWTLSADDTIRWGESGYRVRVHYYSDHDNGGTNYKMTVKLYEGTDREVEYVKTGYLSANNPDNDQPTDVGADWAEFESLFTLTQDNTSSGVSGETRFRANSVSSDVFITKDIPSVEYRKSLKQ